MASLITTFESIVSLIEKDLPLFKQMYSQVVLTADEIEEIYNLIKQLKSSASSNSNANAN